MNVFLSSELCVTSIVPKLKFNYCKLIKNIHFLIIKGLNLLFIMIELTKK